MSEKANQDTETLLRSIYERLGRIEAIVNDIKEDINKMNMYINQLEDRVRELEDSRTSIVKDIEAVKSKYNILDTVIKYIIFPLIGVLGALVGVKLVLPVTPP